MAGLPIEVILTEILPRLPPKTLQRFKCVCKSFQATISSPNFIKVHLRHSLSSGADRLLILPGKCNLLYSYNLDSPESPVISIAIPLAVSRHRSFALYSPNPPPALNIKVKSSINTFSFISVVGSCNGLLCIAKGFAKQPVMAKHFILFNPSTGSYWEIPFLDLNLYRPTVYYGFGFDAAIDDYKLVCILEYFADNNVEMRCVVVYSLRTNLWRWVESSPFTMSQEFFGLTNGDGVFFANNLHWVFWCNADECFKVSIRCFGITSEKWGNDVPLPEYAYIQGSSCRGLGVFDGYLCSTFETRYTSKIEVWVMKEYGVGESWVRLFTIGLSSVPIQNGLILPIAHRRGSRHLVLLRLSSPTELFWYNSKCDAIARAEFNEVLDLSNQRPSICIGSLVTLPGGDQIAAANKRGSWSKNGV